MKKTITVVCLAAMWAGGCTTYYRVTDPTTGKMYYTTELRQKDNGAATLKDARTGTTVNIQNSEIAKVNKEQFESGKAAPPMAAPAPAMQPAAPATETSVPPASPK